MTDTRGLQADLTEAFNAHDVDAIGRRYAADAVFEAPGNVRLEGPDAR